MIFVDSLLVCLLNRVFETERLKVGEAIRLNGPVGIYCLLKSDEHNDAYLFL